jgi:hypothetical protein
VSYANNGGSDCLNRCHGYYINILTGLKQELFNLSHCEMEIVFENGVNRQLFYCIHTYREIGALCTGVRVTGFNFIINYAKMVFRKLDGDQNDTQSEDAKYTYRRR